eukprot:scaffold2.g7267.t1
MVSVADLRKLVAACDAASAETLTTMAAAASSSKLEAEPHLDKAVQEAADAAGAAIISILNPAAVRAALPALFDAMEDKQKWQTKLGALKLLAHLAGAAPEQVSWCLPDIVPPVTNCMVDLKLAVKDAATGALVKCCAALGNRDVEPFVPTLVRCIAYPAEVADCVHKLSATTFVQTVDARTLSILVPLLLRGLTDRTTPIRRKACVIIDNMAKLVDDPKDASEFVAALLPHVQKCMDEMSNPEARGVATRAHANLTSINTTVEPAALRKADPAAVRKALLKAAEGAGAAAPAAEGADDVLAYVAAMCAALCDVKNFEADDWQACVVPYLAQYMTADQAAKACAAFLDACYEETQQSGPVVDEEEGEDLCNCEFSLAYGGKILLNNARLHLKRGQRYGLCGHNGCGKSTLMRAIANGQLEGFPPKDVLRTVYVEHDIDASEAETPVVEFVFGDKTLQDVNAVSHARVEEVLLSVGFTPEMQSKPVASLSGGWKMKLALARAMLMNADILLLDEPTNHLDVANVAWLVNYLTTQCQNVTSLIVSHDSGFLDNVCTGIIHYEKNLKLRKYRDRAILKMRGVNFKYPTAEKRQLEDVTVQVSLNSRVAVVGPNGAGKSTMIKLLTGELEPESGFVWKHPNLRVAYVAQHAFHHIESHLEKTPNQYIQWRYATGEDREALEKVDRKVKEEDEAKMKEKIVVDGEKRVVEKLLGRRKAKKGYEYEVQWVNGTETSWRSRDWLEQAGFTKLVNEVDAKAAAEAGMMGRPLTAASIEKMLGDLGLEPEFASHSQIRGLSGGQKVKLVLGAALWNQPHILVLDEPTNYLDRESLGAMCESLKDFGGGVVVVSHHTEFTNELCPEKWTVGGGKLVVTGQSAAALESAKLEWKRQEETTDAFGNTIKIKGPKKDLSRKEKKAAAKAKAARRARGEVVSDDEE